ncbi:hypothetical protein GCM10009760_51530 [Kitasatospora kazusensis]|uniref:Uncharacterized protein n=1 Tax=Kitasatospora kazusensis TaxID=407974 RepID=A0ABN3A494_9ACTN
MATSTQAPPLLLYEDLNHTGSVTSVPFSLVSPICMGQTSPNSPPATLRAKAVQASREKTNAGPAGSFESR